MRNHCLTCAHYHPFDKSQEVGLCFEGGEIPPVQRYRLRFESWTCWEQNVCGTHAPMLDMSLRLITKLDRKLETASMAEVGKAYWQIVKQERKQRLDQMVG